MFKVHVICNKTYQIDGIRTSNFNVTNDQIIVSNDKFITTIQMYVMTLICTQ